MPPVVIADGLESQGAGRVYRSFTFDFAAEGLDGLALDDPFAELGGHLLGVVGVEI
jgi:hypothetical protein